MGNKDKLSLNKLRIYANGYLSNFHYKSLQSGHKRV
jgi:hypothetical protein